MPRDLTLRSTPSLPAARTSAPGGWRADARWLAPLLTLFVVKQALLVAIVGPFTGHDEVDHAHYIARLAAGEGLGVVGEVRLPPEMAPYRAYVADYPYNAEVIQPPLYHALLAPIVWLPGGNLATLYALRAVSVLLGVAVVWVAYLTARLLFPTDALMRAGVPIFVAFQPQFSFEAAIVNHDILVILLFSVALYLLLWGLGRGFSPRLELALGLVAAAGLWTKVSFGLALPVLALGVVLAWRDRRAPVMALVRSEARVVGLPLLLILPWFIRSFALYGDPTGAQRLREIPGFGAQASSYSEMLTSLSFWRGRLEDFWGNYGWRQVPFDPLDYRIIGLVWAGAGIALLALVIRALVGRLRGAPPLFDRLQWRGIGLMALAILLLLYGVLYVGTIQFTQSRFVFPGMVAFATLTLAGVDRWLPARARPVALPVLVVLLMGLNVVVGLRYLIPFYYGPGGGALINP